MGKKVHAAPEVQSLVNAVMPWAETCLRETGTLHPVIASIATGESAARLETAGAAGDDGRHGALTVQQQEGLLANALRQRWQAGALAAAALVAPVFVSKASTGERSAAVRIHIETRDGYSADILMPYRIRAGWRWRRPARNRVHFSHPVAQESDRLFTGPVASARG